MVSGGEQDELQRLREENACIMGLLTQHGIAWEEQTAHAYIPAPTASAAAQTRFTTDDKIALFRRLFRGREDVYPLRWESAKGTSGYSQACGNEWKPGICPYWGNHFWAKGYCVDTVGVDAYMIRKYVRYQQKQEELQLKMKLDR